jgi:alpha-tubulin suppressor-like RCC1 family protein/fibronectin type 3 domain-containing protein
MKKKVVSSLLVMAVLAATGIGNLPFSTKEKAFAATSKRIFAGPETSFMIDDNGKVYGWGMNDTYQLGLGTTGDKYIPTEVPISGPITKISAGYDHTAYLINGQLWGSGSNYTGDATADQYSTLNKTPRKTYTPIVQSGLTDIDAYTIGYGFKSGQWLIWGYDPFGLDGDGARGGEYPQPIVGNISNVKSGSSGTGLFSLLLTNDGKVYGMGQNHYGQLGRGFKSDQYTVLAPGLVNNLSNIVKVDAGYSHAIAINSSGQLYAWGDNYAGQIGNLSRGGQVLSPVLVMDNVKDAYAGNYFTVALKNDGTVWTWGGNYYGELGLGEDAWQLGYPTQVPGLSNIVAIAAGDKHVLALRDDGKVFAWGSNEHGQIGVNDTRTDEFYTPQEVLTPAPPASINYDKTTVYESPTNDGSISDKIVVTLQNGTFATDVASGVTIQNLPSGLGYTVNRISGTQLEIAFTGKATNHANSNDVTGIQFIIDKSKVTGATTNLTGTFGIDFADPFASLSQAKVTLKEDAANDGSITEKQTLYLANGVFAPDVVNGVTVSNLPAGLTANVVRVSNTQLDITLTGKAVNHANANDISNVQVTIDKSKITNSPTNLTSTFGIDFIDPYASVSLAKTTLKEDAVNDGSVTEKQTVTITNGTFSTDVASGVTFSNVPNGLTPIVNRISATQLEISFSGKASNHANANDVSNIQITIDKSKMTNAVSNFTGTFGIDFKDPYASISMSKATLQEDAANDGSITEKQVITLTNGTFTSDVASGVEVSNLPAGLSANVVRVNDTQLEISFSGKAANHADADDVSNVQITIDKNKINGAVDNVTGSFGIDFIDPYASISLSKTVLKEDAANDGSISEKQVITLSNGTFAADVTTGVTVSNVPAGLTANVVRVSDTELEISFSGKATNHENVHDVSNIQVVIDKAKVSGANQNLVGTFGIDFEDAVFEVSNLQAVIVNNDVNVSWDAAPGADSYLVERYGSDGMLEKTRTVTDISFIDDSVVANKTYEYQVTPKKGDLLGVTKSVTITTPVDLEDGGSTDPTYGEQPDVEDEMSIRIPLNIPGAVYYVVIRNGDLVYEGPGPEFIDRNLQKGVTYRYRVIGYGEDGAPVDTIEKDVQIDPATVNNLRVTNVTEDQITISFDEVSNASDYIVERYKDGQLEERTVIQNTSLTDTLLTPDTEYVYKVKAVINGNQTAPSQVTAKTLADVEEEPSVNSITISTPTVTHNSVTFSWSTEYPYSKSIVKRDGVVINTGDAGSGGQVTDNNLDPNTSYEYTVEVYDSHDNLTGKETLNIITTQEPPVVIGDENFYATNIQTNQVTLNWKAIQGANYYTLYRVKNGVQEYARIVYAPKVSYVDSTVSPGTTYTYRLVPKIGTTIGTPMELTLTTQSADLPVVPSVEYVTVDNGVINVKATNNDPSAVLYVVIQDQSGAVKTRTSITSGVEKEIEGLAAGTYTVKVEAYNKTYKTSSYSDSQTVTITPEMVAAPIPENLTVTVSSNDSTYTLIKSTVEAINDPEVSVYFYLYGPNDNLVSSAIGKVTTDGKIGWNYQGLKTNLVPGDYKVVAKSKKFNNFSQVVEKTFQITN